MQHRLIPLAAVALALALPALPALADGSDSMRVGDLHYGSGLDPTGWAPMLWPKDENGFSYLHAGMKRTPSGALYPYPAARGNEAPDPQSSAWTGVGVLQIGYLTTTGDDRSQFHRQYADWSKGLVLGLLALDFHQPATGNYVELRASHLSSRDQFVRLRAGRLGAYRVQAFYRDMPHLVAANSFPLWDGVGGTRLTVPAPLVPGASTPDAVAAVAATRPRRDIRLTRTRAGVSLEGSLSRWWHGFASVVNEDRKGTRLWGGSMFFNYPFPDNGGVLETVRPVDFRTTDVSLGLRRVSSTWRFNSIYTGSFFRNHKKQLDFESPYALWNVVGTPNAGDIHQGQFSLEPNNDYHNLRLELARPLPQNGDLSLAAAWGTMRQNDDLLPPVTCTGLAGVFIAPPVDYTFDCADWNTPAALSRTTADARIDTALLHAKASFRPSPRFGWHAMARWYKEDNKTNYLAFNPLTGQYGYISENGSQGSVVPGESGMFDPTDPLLWGYNAQVRSIPFAYTDTQLELGADWRLGEKSSLDATWSFERNRPKHRERSRVDENRLQLAWVSRELLGGTLRASLEHARRRGDRYDYDPYAPFYAESLPGFIAEEAGVTAHTTSGMRKYDISDRDETKWRAIYIRPLGETATISATWHGINDSYRAPVGRTSHRNQGVTVALDWQPEPQTSVGAWLGLDRGHIGFANVNDDESVVGADPGQEDPSLGGPLYPLANMWWEQDRQRDLSAGASYKHDFSRGIHFDASWALTFTRNKLAWDAASPGAISGTQVAWVDDVLHGFPNNHYRVHDVDLGLTVPLAQRVGLRFFGRYWRGSFLDWHYLGLDADPVVDHRIYTDRGPQRAFHVGAFGVMVNVGL